MKVIAVFVLLIVIAGYSCCELLLFLRLKAKPIQNGTK